MNKLLCGSIIVGFIALIIASLTSGLVPLDIMRHYSTKSYAGISDPNYMGWKGTSDLLKPFYLYYMLENGVYSINSTTTPYMMMDLYWPQASCPSGFKCLLNDNVAVVVGKIVDVDIMRTGKGTVTILYTIQVMRVVHKPSIVFPKHEPKPCDYTKSGNNSGVCDIEMGINEMKKIKEYIDSLEQNTLITISMPAWLTRKALEKNKTNITIKDVGSPFPLLNKGNTYVIFIRVTKKGYEILYDYVFGPYAYLVKDNKVYSLNYINYPVEMKPEEFFAGEGISWYPRDYNELRNIALVRYSVYGEPLEEFVSKLGK